MLFRIPGWIYDLVVVLIVGATAFAQAFSDGTHLWLTMPISLLGTIAIFFRRRRPLPVLAFETASPSSRSPHAAHATSRCRRAEEPSGFLPYQR
jgi:hypothetical protein